MFQGLFRSGMWTRQWRAGLSALTLAALAGNSSAFAETLVVSGWGGLWEKSMRSAVIEPFQKLNPDVEVVYTVNGGFAEMLAKLRAEIGQSTIDVFSTGGGFELIAADEGLLEEFDASLMPNLADVYAGGIYENRVVANSIAGVGLLYHKERVPRVPTSWYDLWDPAFQPVAVSDISDTYGRALFARINELEGGTNDSQEPGFNKFKELMTTKTPIINVSTDDTVTAIVSRGAALSVAPNSRAIQLIAEGYPVGFIYPKEGAFAWGTFMAVPKGSSKKELAMKFINFWLSPEVQSEFCASVNYGPANTTASLPDQYAFTEYLITEKSLDSAYLLDYKYMNSHLAEWSERWTQEVLPLNQ